MAWHCGSINCLTHSSPEHRCQNWRMAPLSGSVGARGLNRAADVRVVQGALNRVPIGSGGPSPTLATDGLCGPKTVAVIRQVQARCFGWAAPDGRVEANGQTQQLLASQGHGLVPAGPAPRSGDAELVKRIARESGLSGEQEGWLRRAWDLWEEAGDMTGALKAVFPELPELPGPKEAVARGVAHLIGVRIPHAVFGMYGALELIFKPAVTLVGEITEAWQMRPRLFATVYASMGWAFNYYIEGEPPRWVLNPQWAGAAAFPAYEIRKGWQDGLRLVRERMDEIVRKRTTEIMLDPRLRGPANILAEAQVRLALRAVGGCSKQAFLDWMWGKTRLLAARKRLELYRRLPWPPYVERWSG